jgi:hypothetical protein
MTKLKNTEGQTELSARKNAQFFLEEHASYKEKVGAIDTYKKISQALSAELAGIRKLLDVGNGGVFDYDTSLIPEIVGLDLFLDALPKDVVIPSNIRMRQGSALAIPNDLRDFDAVLMVMLIHHLVGKTVAICQENVQKSFDEAHKVIGSKGKLIVMDSCVPHWFFLCQRLAFGPAAWVISKTMKHPPVLQHTAQSVIKMMRQSGFNRVQSIVIPKGRFILQFGIKVPSFVTPTQPTLFIGYKD